MSEKWVYDRNELIYLYVDCRKSIMAIAKMKNSGYKAVRNALLREGVVLRAKYTEGDPRGCSEATKEKLRQQRLGDKNPNWKAASMTDKTRKLLSEARKGKKDSPEICKKRSEGRKGKGCGERNSMKREECVRKWIAANNIKPNKKELQLKQILDDLFPNVFAINTKGEHAILNGCIPDFVSADGSKKVIEMFGDYWHKGENEQFRIDKFAKLGYKTLIVWERELLDLNILEKKLRGFNEGNKVSE